MELNINLWDKAENDFQEWMSKPAKEGDELIHILRATILFNRKKLRSVISGYLDKPIRLIEESELMHEFDLDYMPSNVIQESRLRPIDKKQDQEWEWGRKNRNQKKNEQIIYAFLNNYSPAINMLYEEEFPKILRMVLSNSGDVDNARDIFQEGLIVVIENTLNKKIDLTDSFSSYLYGVCRILWLNQLKKQKRNIQIDIENTHFNTKFVYHEDYEFLVNEKVFAIIESLGDTCKKLLDYYYYRQMNWETISEQLGYSSAESAKNQKYKCLEKIRKQMAEKGDV